MENQSTRIKYSVYKHSPTVINSQRENLYRTLSNDGCEDFYNYIDWLDMAKGWNVIVLPATRSFYYMPEDLKNTETVINLKPLNLIKDLRSFLVKIYTFLPEYSYFTGYFEDYNYNVEKQNGELDKKQPGEDVNDGSANNKRKEYNSSRLYHAIKSFFDPRLKRQLSKRSATSLLENAGFTVHDITELNGKKYFCAQKRDSAGS